MNLAPGAGAEPTAAGRILLGQAGLVQGQTQLIAGDALGRHDAQVAPVESDAAADRGVRTWRARTGLGLGWQPVARPAARFGTRRPGVQQGHRLVRFDPPASQPQVGGQDDAHRAAVRVGCRAVGQGRCRVEQGVEPVRRRTQWLKHQAEQAVAVGIDLVRRQGDGLLAQDRDHHGFRFTPDCMDQQDETGQQAQDAGQHGLG